MTNTPDERRKRRLAQLAGKLGTDSANGKEQLILTRVCAWACMQWGVKQETFASYLDVLEDAGLVEVDIREDTITWVGK